MTRLAVWGSSDDLVDIFVVDGYPDGFVSVAEYGRYDTSKEAPVELSFSDGTVLHVWYGDEGSGCWRVVVAHQGEASVVIIPAESSEGIYTDVAFLTLPDRDLRLQKAMCEGEVMSE